jgi:hypothetical protein
MGLVTHSVTHEHYLLPTFNRKIHGRFLSLLLLSSQHKNWNKKLFAVLEVLPDWLYTTGNAALKIGALNGRQHE